MWLKYVGKLLNGKVFDYSEEGKPYELTVGTDHSIEGLSKGVVGLQRGSRAIIYCPPEYAYGERETSDIPANSTLMFEVEIVDWEKF